MATNKEYFKGIEDVLDRYAEIINTNIQKELDWTSNLKNQARAEREGQSVVLFTPLYGYVIDQGRAFGSQGKYPPWKPLADWARSKNIPQWRDQKTGRFISYKQQAFLIARKIKWKGIDGWPKPWIDQSIELKGLLVDVAELLANNMVIAIEKKTGAEVEKNTQ